MSLFDYQVSKTIAVADYPFYALVMAAMRQADSENLAKLTRAFPHIWAELHARYNAPGGVFAAEQIPAMSRGEQLDEIMRDLDTTGAAWAAAGHPDNGPEFEAREAVFGRLRAWNAAEVPA